MRNLFLLTCLSMFSLSFGQSEKQAYEAFKKSDVRKELRISLKTFQNISQQVYDGQNFNFKNAIGFSNNNSKDFLKKVKVVYKQWHGNDKEMILILSKNDIIDNFEMINKQP